MNSLQWKWLKGPSVMEDAQDSIIQETRQEQQPARMVGLFLLDSVRFGMEADDSDLERFLLQGGER